jgi:5'-nucleotidase
MKKLFSLLLMATFFGVSLYAQKLVILHTNDMHSKLTGFGPEMNYSPLELNNDSTLGGFARLAALINQEKNANQGASLVFDAGDFLMGTIFQAKEAETGFQLLLMKKMGYDAVTIGNHEFDFGPNMLAKILNAGFSRGEMPEILATQFQFSAESKEDDNLAQLVNEKKIKPYVVYERNGLKIGVFGIIGVNAVEVAPASAPLTFADRIKTAAEVTKTLREKEKVDVVVCLSHSGVYYDENGVIFGEDIELAQKVPDIDVILSGHTHVKTEKATHVGKTLVVQTGAYAENLGRVELNYTAGKLASWNFRLMPVNDQIMGDELVNKLIEDYQTEIDAEYFKPFGIDYYTVLAETSYLIFRGDDEKKIEGSVGTLLADAINFYTDKFSTPSDMVIVAHGIVRENIMPGKISPADAFRVAPLGSGKSDLPGYSLAQIYITGHEIKLLMELILMANKPGADSYLYFSGVEADYNPNKMMLKKVEKVRLNGTEISIDKKDEKLYTISANTYLLSFIGEVKKMSKGLIKIIPKDAKGNPVADVKSNLLDFDANTDGIQEGKEWIALIEFFKQFPDVNANGIPDVSDEYKTPPQRLHPTEPKKK